jgi:DNA-binding transcriptional regulator YdaS (Cro superfamily)
MARPKKVKYVRDRDRAPGVAAAIKAAGSLRILGKLLGIDHTAVAQWTRIPADRLIEIERVTKVPREKLRPDLYR